MLTRRLRGVLGTIEQQGHLCATPDQIATPGLLTGLSGIGYALLRLGYPEQVPSVALFSRAVEGPGRLHADRTPRSHPNHP